MTIGSLPREGTSRPAPAGPTDIFATDLLPSPTAERPSHGVQDGPQTRRHPTGDLEAEDALDALWDRSWPTVPAGPAAALVADPTPSSPAAGLGPPECDGDGVDADPKGDDLSRPRGSDSYPRLDEIRAAADEAAASTKSGSRRISRRAVEGGVRVTEAVVAFARAAHLCPSVVACDLRELGDMLGGVHPQQVARWAAHAEALGLLVVADRGAPLAPALGLVGARTTFRVAVRPTAPTAAAEARLRRQLDYAAMVREHVPPRRPRRKATDPVTVCTAAPSGTADADWEARWSATIATYERFRYSARDDRPMRDAAPRRRERPLTADDLFGNDVIEDGPPFGRVVVVTAPRPPVYADPGPSKPQTLFDYARVEEVKRRAGERAEEAATRRQAVIAKIERRAAKVRGKR